MAKAWVIVCGDGEYSNRNEVPVRVYLDQQAAQAMMAQLGKLADKYVIDSAELVKMKPIAKWQDRLKEKIKNDYAALGFDMGYLSSDWALFEVDLVSRK